MNLLTQNSDLKKTGIFGWTLPAHFVTLSNGIRFNTCPNAGVCGAMCYAKNGTYKFSNVKKAHLEKLELVLNTPEKWFDLMNEELKKKKYINKFIRVHDGGDFYSENYAKMWIEIAKKNNQIIFYSYTKEVDLFKNKLKNLIPENFIIIYSFGGKQDNLIDRKNDRHSDVFTDYNKMIELGYNDIKDDDKLAAVGPKKVGLFRNNIKHFIKKQGSKSFGEWSLKKIL